MTNPGEQQADNNFPNCSQWHENYSRGGNVENNKRTGSTGMPGIYQNCTAL